MDHHTTPRLPMYSPPLALLRLRSRKPKLKYGPTFIALFGLIALSTYIFFVAKPSLDFAPISLPNHSDVGPPNDLNTRRPSSRVFRFPPAQNYNNFKLNSNKPQIQLTPPQELAALSSFLASLPHNMIPRSVDPTKPIDPQLVLGFDTRSVRAMEEVHQIEEEVWARHPVMLFTKMHGTSSREVRLTLSAMKLRPTPTIIDVDQREDAEVLTPLLYRLTSSTELPILLVGGKPVGSMDDIRSLNNSGELQTMISAAGAVPDVTKKKKGRN